jgi:hypothetical protein
MSQSSQERLPPAGGSLEIHPRKVFGLGLIFKSMLGRFWQRSILALVLMIAVFPIQLGLLLVTVALFRENRSRCELCKRSQTKPRSNASPGFSDNAMLRGAPWGAMIGAETIP